MPVRAEGIVQQPLHRIGRHLLQRDHPDHPHAPPPVHYYPLTLSPPLPVGLLDGSSMRHYYRNSDLRLILNVESTEVTPK